MATDGTGNPLDPGLTARHNDAAKLLAAGLSWTAVAETLGVSRSTLARLMKAPGMRPLIDGWRAQNVAGVLASLIPEALASIRFLADMRDNPEVADSVRVAAAREILQSSARLGRPSSIGELTETQARDLFRSEALRIVTERGAG